jgi:splicing factor U2AF subunit
MTQWDIKPAGYDNITAEQAKLSGQFPLPGAPRAAPMDPSKLAAFANPETGTASTSGLAASNSLQARRLFIYNIPQEITNDEIVEFWNLQLNGLNVVSGRDPCVSANIANNRIYAAITFKTAEDATVALAMDNIAMRDGDQVGLSIRRPKDYITPIADGTVAAGDTVSSHVADSPNKLSITNIPTYVEEEQVRELVETFGALKAFVLVKDTSTEQHRVSIS